MNLDTLQKWVAKDWEQFPAEYPTPPEQLLLLVEEVGEVAELLRKSAGNKARKDIESDIGGELCDVLISLVTLANTFEVDLSSEVQRFKSKLASRRQ